MAYTLDDLLKKASGRLEGVHPSVKAGALQLITKAYSKGVKLIITQGLRTITEQNKLYAKGRTTSQLRAVGISGIAGNPSAAKVTNAKGGTSYHNYGLAFDIGILNKTEDDVDWTDSKYKPLGALGKELGLEWGGDWKTIKDNPHFQLSFGLSIKDLQAGKRPNGSTVSKNPGIAVVKKGSEGTSVNETQQMLNELGFNAGTVDGIAGDKTVEAIKAFQKANKLDVDGIAGKDTLAKINDLINKKKEEEKQKEIANRVMTIQTGGVNIAAQTELKRFMSGIGEDTTLVFKAEGGNPYAEITAKGANLVKIIAFLKEKGWYYTEVK